MRAVLRIQAFICDAQPFYRLAPDQMFPHNLVRVFRLDVAIPNRLGINHHRGPMLALVQTAGFVNPHASRQACFFGQLLQPRMKSARSIFGARRTGRALGPHIVANKNVVFKNWQSCLLENANCEKHSGMDPRGAHAWVKVGEHGS